MLTSERLSSTSPPDQRLRWPRPSVGKIREPITGIQEIICYMPRSIGPLLPLPRRCAACNAGSMPGSPKSSIPNGSWPTEWPRLDRQRFHALGDYLFARGHRGGQRDTWATETARACSGLRHPTLGRSTSPSWRRSRSPQCWRPPSTSNRSVQPSSGRAGTSRSTKTCSGGRWRR